MKIKNKDGEWKHANKDKEKLIQDLKDDKLTLKQVQKILAKILDK